MNSRFLFLALCLSFPLSACTVGGGGGNGGNGPNGDLDGDGLSNGEEEELGTDPENADTDGDGWSDPEEIDIGTDPVDRFDWDFGGEQWPDFSAEAEAAGMLDATEYAMGEVMPNFEYRDQFDKRVNLSQFYGYVVLVDLSAGWCGPCRQLAETSNELWEELRGEGFMIVHLMVDDLSADGNIDDDYPPIWADDFDITFPVLAERDGDVSDALYSAGIYTGSIPFQLILDQEMRIAETITGVSPTADDDLRDIFYSLVDE